MIPRRLSLVGVYSYRKKQIIDFSTLSEAGIFGVFGNVGSGKSAILEAMTYALYGQIERLNDKEQRGYNIMNLQSSSMAIEFDFLKDSSEYRFTVTARRNRNDFSKIQSPERRGYRKEKGEWIPLPDEGIRGGITAEGIIGLSYEHFRKTVIIPQGRFQEFIQLPPSQRTAMIETLFGLQRFNLSADCNFLLARSREECSFIEGRLTDLQYLNREDLEELEGKALEGRKRILKGESKKKDLSEQLSLLKDYSNNRMELDRTEASLISLEKQRIRIEETEEQLAGSRRLTGIFTPLTERESALETELQDLNKESQEIALDRQSLEERMKGEEEYWNSLKSDQENYGVLKKTLDSLKALEELSRLSETENRRDRQHAVLIQDLQELRNQLSGLKEEESGLDEALQRQEEENEQTDQLPLIEDWYRRSDLIEEQIQEVLQKQNRLTEQKSREEKTLFDLYPETGSLESEPRTTLEALVNRLLQKQEEELEQRTREQIRFRLISSLSEDLQEGKPCPLCGSEHHPQSHIPGQEAVRDDSDAEIERLKTALKDQKEKTLELLHSLKHIQTEQKNLENRMIHLQKSRTEHRESFSWPFLEADNREQLKEFKRSVLDRRSAVKTLQQQKAELQKNREQLDRGIREREEELIRLESASDHSRSERERLESLLLKEHRGAAPDTKAQDDLNRRLGNLERDYNRIKSARVRDEQILQNLISRSDSYRRLLDKTTEETNRVKETIRECLKKENLQSREELSSRLKVLENSAALEQEIDSFRKNWSLLTEQKKNLKQRLAELEQSPLLKTADAAGQAALEEQLKILETELQQLHSESGALGNRITEIQSGLKRKEELTEQLAAERIREENLKELSSLFKGGKFVQYIAAVYMQEMCQLANTRFSPLTGRSLELVFQDNQIMVRDFLNEGRLRHIKTLSGGQSFQAALCLALALADQTGRGKGSFFFLDEGFGSLDKNSLETVMQTLRELSREGRIIGLISHVEEMQQDLDVWIRINRDSEQGSRITNSWKQTGQ
ncbi:MAG: SMC family ATPase [Spirochaetales bacterium]|nr:SMC family ATPase [Spirochaetales bacterium]